MAKRRMFSVDIVKSDAFLDMPASSQLLYFHLGMEADDDGFIGNAKTIARMVNSSDDDMKILTAKRFVLLFPNGIVVIKHWKINNMIQKDRYKETKYVDEKKALITKENGAYTECIQNGNSLESQSSIGKVRLGKATSAAKAASPPKKEKKPDEPMTLLQFVEWCKKSNQRHINIIGEWAETVKPELITRDQWQTYIKRHLRAARDLVPFTQDQLDAGYRKMMAEKDWLKRYTLETLTKFLT